MKLQRRENDTKGRNSVLMIRLGTEEGFSYVEQWPAARAGRDRVIEATEPDENVMADQAPELVVARRLLLYPFEASRLPRACRAVRVRSGVAWVTHAGQDIVVREGETAHLNGGRGFAVASPLHGTPLILEVLTRQAERRSWYKGIATAGRRWRNSGGDNARPEISRSQHTAPDDKGLTDDARPSAK